jgi:hypothetical protein
LELPLELLLALLLAYLWELASVLVLVLVLRSAYSWVLRLAYWSALALACALE